VTIAEPLAYWPDQRVLVQGPIREDLTLKELIRPSLGQGTPEALDQLDEYMAKTAAGLAALHRCGVRHGATATWNDQVAEIRGLMERLADPIPEIGGAVEPLLAWLAGLDARNPAQPVAPAHGTFRPAQVLLHQGEIGFIDFDGFCQAEPALDVALFRAGIKDIGAGYQQPAGTAGATSSNPESIGVIPSALEALAEDFLRHYEAVATVSRERVMLWETVHLLIYVLHAWTKVSAKRLPVRMAVLREHLLTSGLPA
jgi:aminoglycoside phosphotransferase (APT) family kinase protein